MVLNPFYVEVETIINRIGRKFRSKALDKNDAIEWSAECEIDYIEDFDYFAQYINWELPVTNGRAYPPCLTYKLLDVHGGTARVPYKKHGPYIVVEKSLDKVFVNFLGIPVSEETGMPLILRGHEQAVEAFIVYNLHYEDFIKGKIHPNIYLVLLDDMNNKIEAARSTYRYLDNARLENLQAIRGNMVPVLANIELFKLYQR